MSWIFLIIAAVGLSHIIVDSSLLARFRGYVESKDWKWVKELISCYQCTGFWSGVLVSLINEICLSEFNFLNMIFNPLLFGLASSIMSMFCAASLNYLDRPWSKDE